MRSAVQHNFEYISEITRPDYGRQNERLLMRRLIMTNERSNMKIVVIGGSGLIGSKLVTKLGEYGHRAVAASPASGVNTLTGEGLAEGLEARPGGVACRTQPRSRPRP